MTTNESECLKNLPSIEKVDADIKSLQDQLAALKQLRKVVESRKVVSHDVAK